VTQIASHTTEPRDGPDGPPRSPLTITTRGVIGTLLLLLVVGGCIRLGFWQLARHDARQERNTHVAARLDARPLGSLAGVSDTAGIFYRSATLTGEYDAERSIILPGRSLRGVPGVHLLSPLRPVEGGPAVLVNRGWVPSPDAATIDVADFAVDGIVSLTGLVLPFPGADQSLTQRPDRGARASDEFRQVWYVVDEQALRGQYPYPLLTVMLQALPEEGAAPAARGSYPARLEPPPLDPGPHFGYALQWFSFALIGLVGWLALILRGRVAGRHVAPPLVLAITVVASQGQASAQLRPLEPADWRVFEGSTWLAGDAGVGLLREQRASPAGTIGTLLEAGNYGVTFRSGRLAVSLGGTAALRLSDEQVYAAPLGEARPADGSPRTAAGRAMAATLFRLSPDEWPLDVVVRFGAVLPTTSHRSGLDRDRTDFFATGALRFRHGLLTLTTEHGVGINGTLFSNYPQSDVWVYTAGATLQAPSAGLPLRLVTELVGHRDGINWEVRGNEEQQELRLGADIGRTRFASVRYIRGRTPFSPSSGIRLSGGFLLDRRR